MNKTQVADFYARLAAANPAPTTELAYASPFQLLIAVILSAQATDVGVNKATARLFPVAPTPEAMLALGEDGVAEYIKTIGLFRTKARNVTGPVSRPARHRSRSSRDCSRSPRRTSPGTRITG